MEADPRPTPHEVPAPALPTPLPTPKKRGPGQRWLFTAVVIGFALVGVALSAATDRLDSALLFVGIPCGLAWVVGMLPTGRGWPSVFQAVTVLLLLASALLHEGALCVLLASPLIYGAAAVGHAIAQSLRGSRPDAAAPQRRLALAPIVAVLALEGLLPGWRINPDQTSVAARVVEAPCARVIEHLAHPTVSTRDRVALLGVAQYPTPVAITGEGLRPGDRWQLRMPAGQIDTLVADSRLAAHVGRVDFTVSADTARTTRWVRLHRGSVRWSAQPSGGCRVEVHLDYTRKLDPSWWFGPITDTFMHAGAASLLNTIDPAE